MSERAEALTAILNQLGTDGTDDSAVARILPYVYDELRGLADAYLRGERPNHTLQATALVHEAFLRMAGPADRVWTDRRHFFRIAAKTMRHILVDHGRARAADKRGGGAAVEVLTDAALALDAGHVRILEVDDALEQLFSLSPEKARVVELRIYGGCTIAETAEALEISPAKVERDWRFSRAWLKAKLNGNV